MKRSELKRLIKEEITSLLKEFNIIDFNPKIDKKELIDGQKFFQRFLPKSAKTIKNSVKQIENWRGEYVSTHIWVEKVDIPNFGEVELYNTQHWVEASPTNITKVDIIKDRKTIGCVYVDTKTFGKEIRELK